MLWLHPVRSVQLSLETRQSTTAFLLAPSAQRNSILTVYWGFWTGNQGVESPWPEWPDSRPTAGEGMGAGRESECQGAVTLSRCQSRLSPLTSAVQEVAWGLALGPDC